MMKISTKCFIEPVVEFSTSSRRFLKIKHVEESEMRNIRYHLYE
jgi:hypothetical protein